MSTDLAITAVTRTIRQVLADNMASKWGGDVLEGDLGSDFVVANVLPNKVRETFAVQNVVNVYLYRTELNAAWRNLPLPSQTKPGEKGTPPLALNLEYLITAYGENEREDAAHFFLGQAMRVLHDNAVIGRAAFHTVLPKALVHRQLEQVTITPHPLAVEEMSKLWSVLGTPYRISAVYLVTVLLIESRTVTQSAPPVLKRGIDDSGITALASAPPVLDSAQPATGFPAVRLGEELLLRGERLDGGGLTAVLRHPSFAEPRPVAVTPIHATSVKIAIPAIDAEAGVSAAWPAGLYSVALLVARPGLPNWSTNEVPFALAPTLTVSPITHTPIGAAFEVTLTIAPQVRATQDAIVILGGEQLAPKTLVTPDDPDAVTTITFDAPGIAGMHRVRVRIGGVDSIPIVKNGEILEFDRDQSIEVKNP
jgi:hypothetical protein